MLFPPFFNAQPIEFQVFPEIPEATRCSVITRIALQIIGAILAISLSVTLGLVIGDVISEWSLLAAIPLGLLAEKINRYWKILALREPDYLAKVQIQAKKMSFKELLGEYSLARIIGYRILPPNKLRAKALKYLEDLCIKEENAPSGVLDELRQYTIIDEHEKIWFEEKNLKPLSQTRILIELQLNNAL